MKKLGLLLIVGILALSPTWAFSFKVLGYVVSYDEPVEQIGLEKTRYAEISTIIENRYLPSTPQNNVPKIEQKWDSDVLYANSLKEVQFTLKELDYRRIGFIELDTQEEYTIIINQEGQITMVLKGLEQPEVILKGSESKIRYLLENEKYADISNHLEMPWSLKIKLMTMRWF